LTVVVKDYKGLVVQRVFLGLTEVRVCGILRVVSMIAADEDFAVFRSGTGGRIPWVCRFDLVMVQEG